MSLPSEESDEKEAPSPIQAYFPKKPFSRNYPRDRLTPPTLNNTDPVSPSPKKHFVSHSSFATKGPPVRKLSNVPGAADQLNNSCIHKFRPGDQTTRPPDSARQMVSSNG